MKIIHQGKPKSGYFTILQPVPGGAVEIGDNIKCVDPKTKAETFGQCVARWRLNWTDVPDSFCLLTYGVKAIDLKKAIEKRKNFKNKDEISFLLIEELPEQTK